MSETKEQIIALIEDIVSNSIPATLYQIASLLRIVKQDIKSGSLKNTERERVLNSVNAIKARVEEYNANSMWEPSKMSIGVLELCDEIIDKISQKKRLFAQKKNRYETGIMIFKAAYKRGKNTHPIKLG